MDFFQTYQILLILHMLKLLTLTELIIFRRDSSAVTFSS
nr:MAG TPA: hypothetical protein [Caudoviricetes sp.]